MISEKGKAIDRRGSRSIVKTLKEEVESLRNELAEKTQTLEAIQSGEVDAIVVSSNGKEQIYTLKGAEEPYRILFEQMNDGAFTISLDGGILYCNKSFAASMRTSLERVIGSNIENFIHHSKRGRFRELMEMSMEEPVRDDVLFEAADGSVVPMQLSINYLPSGDNGIFCIVVADLTERIQAEEALRKANEELEMKVEERTKDLRESEAKFRDVFETVQEVFYIDRLIYDEQGKVIDWVFEELNPAGFNLLGLPDIDQVRGRKGSEVLGPETASFYLPMIERARQSDGPVSFQYHSPHVDKDFLASYIIHGDRLISAQMDISEIKKADKELRKERDLAQKYLDLAGFIIVSLDLDGKIRILNRKGCEIIDCSVSPVGRSWFDFIPKRDRNDMREVFAKLTEGTGSIEDYTNPILSLNGEERLISWHNTVLRDDEGRVVATLSSGEDVTERKQAEDALKRSNEELQQFAYVASHDLQEPLRMTISYLSLLERKTKGQFDPQTSEYIAHAVRGGARMRELIDDLLEYSRVESKKAIFTSVDMEKVVERTLDLLREPILDNDAVIEVGPLPSVKADESQMVQLMQNLISNAIKFHNSKTPKVRISATSVKGEWVFSVKDNGIGLNMEYSEKIFQVFQKLHTKDQYPGTGVGLAIVKKILERHGGRVWVESEEGKGATFFFTIPTV